MPPPLDPSPLGWVDCRHCPTPATRLSPAARGETFQPHRPHSERALAPPCPPLPLGESSLSHPPSPTAVFFSFLGQGPVGHGDTYVDRVLLSGNKNETHLIKLRVRSTRR